MKDFLKYVNFAVTVTNSDNVIKYMNNKSIETFEKDGGEKLIGTNVIDCHPEPSKSKLKNMIKNKTKNVYIIQKNNKTKLIYQEPYFEDNIYKGFIELSLEIPENLEKFIRD